MSSFDVRDFSALNLERCNTWHAIDDWSPMEWGAAAAGEMGELCNVLKKIKRYDQSIQQNATSASRTDLVQMAADEIADTICYLDLVAASLGIDLSAAVTRKFNAISRREDLPQRLAVDAMGDQLRRYSCQQHGRDYEDWCIACDAARETHVAADRIAELEAQQERAIWELQAQQFAELEKCCEMAISRGIPTGHADDVVMLLEEIFYHFDHPPKA